MTWRAETPAPPRTTSTFAVTIVSSLTNGYCGYVPTPEAFKHGGYETCRTVYTRRLVKDGGDRIMLGSTGLLRAMDAELQRHAASR